MRNVLIVSTLTLFLSSCVVSTGIRSANTQVEFNREDFEISEPFTAEAEVVKILGIDWKRFFKGQIGNFHPQGHARRGVILSGAILSGAIIAAVFPLGVIPPTIIISTIIISAATTYSAIALSLPTAQDHALSNLLKEHEGYDVVFYPRFEKDRVRIPIFYSKTKAKVTARLGKLK